MRSVSLLVFCLVAFTLTGQSRLRDDPRTEAVARLLQPVTAELTDARFEDAIVFLGQVNDVEIEVEWLDESASGVGLDRDALVTMSSSGQDGLAFLERLLEKADDGFDAPTWQVTTYGSIEVAPRSVLHRRAYPKLYDVQDLILVIPDFTETPDLELGSIVQGQGGSEQDSEVEVPAQETEEERLQRLVELIQTSVEFDQWRDNGGDGASATPYRSSLLIRAPGYIHRQIGGVEYWPTAEEVRRVAGR